MLGTSYRRINREFSTEVSMALHNADLVSQGFTTFHHYFEVLDCSMTVRD
jgi:hypothetical protein